MAVNVGQRNVPDTPSNRKCYAVDKCCHLCKHVLIITANTKVLESPHADLAQRIRDLALGAYSCVYVANRVDTKTKDRKKLEMRATNQESALVAKAMKGEISIEKADECYRSWKAHAQHGNSYQLLAKLDEYYNSLKRRAHYA